MDLFRDAEIARLRDELEHRRRVAGRHRGRRAADRRSEDARLALIEGDIARLTLLATTLTEAVVRKGILSREQVRALSAEIDALDGVVDGRLDPAALRGGGDPAAGR